MSERGDTVPVAGCGEMGRGILAIAWKEQAMHRDV